MEATAYHIFNSRRRMHYLVGITVLLASALTQVNSDTIYRRDHLILKKLFGHAGALRNCTKIGREAAGAEAPPPSTASTTAAGSNLLLCPAIVTVDYNRHRVPENITTVKCRCGGHNLCPAPGDYRCTGIQHPFPVMYKNGTTAVLHVTVTCACVRNPSAPAERKPLTRTS